MDKFNIIVIFEQFGHFSKGLHVDHIEFGIEIMIFIEFVDDGVFGCVVGELETDFSTLEYLTNIFESLIDSALFGSCARHGCLQDGTEGR